MINFRHLAISGLALLTAASVIARPATQEEQAAIEARMEAFLSAMDAGRYDEVAEISIAPKVWMVLSNSMGMELEQLRPAIASQLGSIMEQFEMSNIVYNVSDIELTDTESLTYGYFSNEFDVTVGDEVTHIVNPIFALNDDDRWYILRIDQQQLPVLQGVYPELVELTIPETIVSEPIE